MRKHPLLILVAIVISSFTIGFLFHSDPTTAVQQNKATSQLKSHQLASGARPDSDIALASFVSAKHRANRRAANEQQEVAHARLLTKYRQYVAHKAQVEAKRETAEAGGVWAKLRACESQGDYSIDTGNGYYGAYQFSLATWRSIGQSGLPDQAPPSVQDNAARQLQAKAGWRAWPRCSVELGLQ